MIYIERTLYSGLEYTSIALPDFAGDSEKNTAVSVNPKSSKNIKITHCTITQVNKDKFLVFSIKNEKVGKQKN